MRKILLLALFAVITSCTKKDVRSTNYWNDETAWYDGGKEWEINTIYKRKSYKRIEKKSTEKGYYKNGNVKYEIKVNEEYEKPYRPWEIFKSGQYYLYCCQILKSDRPIIINRDNLEVNYKDQGLSVGADSAVNIEDETRRTIVTNMDNGSRLAEQLRTEYNVEGTIWYKQSYPDGIKLFEIKSKWDPDAKGRSEDDRPSREDIFLIREYFRDGTSIANEKIFKNGELDQLILYSAFDGRKRVIEKDDFDRLGISH